MYATLADVGYSVWTLVGCGFLLPYTLNKTILLSRLSILSIPNEEYSRNTSCKNSSIFVFMNEITRFIPENLYTEVCINTKTDIAKHEYLHKLDVNYNSNRTSIKGTHDNTQQLYI